MGTNRIALSDEALVSHVETRINAGATMTRVAGEIGLSRQRLETRLLRCGWKLGRCLVPVPQIQLQEGKR